MMAALHDEIVTYSRQDTDALLGDIVADTIINNIYDNLDAEDIQIYQFVGIIDYFIDSFEISHSFKEKLHNRHKQRKHCEKINLFVHAFDNSHHIRSILLDIRTKLRLNIDKLLKTVEPFEAEEFIAMRLVNKVLEQDEHDEHDILSCCDLKMLEPQIQQMIESTIQRLNIHKMHKSDYVGFKLRYSVYKILDKNKTDCIRKLKLIKIEKLFIQKSRELLQIEKVYTHEHNKLRAISVKNQGKHIDITEEYEKIYKCRTLQEYIDAYKAAIIKIDTCIVTSSLASLLLHNKIE
jgi:hypothetical protein